MTVLHLHHVARRETGGRRRARRRDRSDGGRLGAVLGGLVALLILIGLLSTVCAVLAWSAVRLLVALVG
jgi:hypothetical protein